VQTRPPAALHPAIDAARARDHLLIVAGAEMGRRSSTSIGCRRWWVRRGSRRGPTAVWRWRTWPRPGSESPVRSATWAMRRPGCAGSWRRRPGPDASSGWACTAPRGRSAAWRRSPTSSPRSSRTCAPRWPPHRW